MAIKGTDLGMKWNDYKAKYMTDELYLWNGKTLFVIQEGSGVNLTLEDEENGYVDYWMTYSYTNENKCIECGGQWLETKPISEINYTIQELYDRMNQCDLWDDNWVVLPEKIGYEARDAYESWYNKTNFLKLMMSWMDDELQKG